MSKKQKKLLTLDQNQSTLTEFFPLQDSVDALFKESNFPQIFMSKIPEEINFSTFLFQELVANAQKNLKCDPSQRKHNDT